MPRNGSGTYSLPAGNPPTAGTAITVSWSSTTLSDIATALTNSIAVDGQSVITANIPMASFKLTGLAAGSTAGDSVRYEQVLLLAGGTVTGDVIFSGATLTLPNTGLHLLDTNASHDLIIAPGSNITADRTLTITTGDADRTLTLSGNLTVGNTTTLNGVPTLGTAQATTSGTTIDFTSIPSWVTEIVISFIGVSTNGSSNLIIQIGDSGGVQTSGYLGTAGATPANFTTGFGLTNTNAAGAVQHGRAVLTLENASAFTWACSSALGRSDAAGFNAGAGSKSLSAALDRVRITAVNGTDAFDAGEINIRYS